MAYPNPVQPGPLVPPAPRPLVAVSSLPALGGRYFYYFRGGDMSGDSLTYRDLSGFIWWTPVNMYGRISSNVREDAGSVFEATAAIAIDAAVSEVFPWSTPIESGDPLAFVEWCRPDEVAFQYYAARNRNMEMRVSVAGETVMSRLDRTIPPAIMISAAAIPGNVDGTVTAQQAIQYIFDQWEQTYDWFGAEPVPDLRILTDAAVGNEREFYIYNPTAGVLRAAAIVIPQTMDGDRDERVSMRDIIEQFLQIFPGTIIRANSEGRVELVPRIGPDVQAVPKALSWRDITAISDGEGDPRGIVNQASVEMQGWQFQEEQVLMPPTHTVFYNPDFGLHEGALDEYVPENSEPLPNGEARQFDVFADPSEGITVNAELLAYTGGSPASTSLNLEATVARTLTLNEGDVVQQQFSWNIFNVDTVRVTVTFARRNNTISVTFDPATRVRFGPNPFVGMRYGAYSLELTEVSGHGYTRGNRRITARFGYSPDDVLPDAEGGNAVANSIAVFGERSATIQSTIFQLDAEQAQALARGYVMTNINPRTIREVRQSLWNAYPVRFEDMGRYVQLPNGEVAVVESRDYSDVSTMDSFASSSTFLAAVSHSVLDSGTPWLLFDNGTIFQLDDNTQVEES